MKGLILYLIRQRLGLKRNERFQFVNQKSDAVYWFTKECVMKKDKYGTRLSTVSLNWLLDDECEIVPVEGGEL